jgi:hypothetical protein
MLHFVELVSHPCAKNAQGWGTLGGNGAYNIVKAGPPAAVVESSRWRRSCSVVTEAGKRYLKKYCGQAGIILHRSSCSEWTRGRGENGGMRAAIKADFTGQQRSKYFNRGKQHVAVREGGYETGGMGWYVYFGIRSSGSLG